jgi:hypothetical protein
MSIATSAALRAFIPGFLLRDIVLLEGTRDCARGHRIIATTCRGVK